MTVTARTLVYAIVVAAFALFARAPGIDTVGIGLVAVVATLAALRLQTVAVGTPIAQRTFVYALAAVAFTLFSFAPNLEPLAVVVAQTIVMGAMFAMTRSPAVARASAVEPSVAMA